MVKVKICGLTRHRDVDEAIELGADALGFIHEPTSPRFLADRGLRLSLLQSVPPFLVTVGVYGIYRNRLDGCGVIQATQFALDHTENRDAIVALRLKHAVTADEAQTEIDQLKANAPAGVIGVVIDGYSATEFGGSGVRPDWEVAARLARKNTGKCILAGGLTPDNVADAVRIVRPYAVDVSSGIESSPGIKDHAKMRDFIQAAKEA